MNRKKIIYLVLGIFISVIFLQGCVKTDTTRSEKQDAPIVIASKPFAEQYILAFMAAELIKTKANATVDTSKIGMGPSELLHPAMEKGQIDIYPEYTGTAWIAILKQPVEYDKDVLYKKVTEAYNQKFKLDWLPSLGFQNTFALAVTRETADKNNIKTISDLAKLKDLTLLGDATSFTREDEYPGLKKIYGLEGKQKVVDVNFYYEGLKQRQADVALVFSTDGRLKQYNLIILEDDKHFFPPYETGFIVRQEVVQKHPKVKEALSLLNGKINEKTMIELNYQVEVEKRDPAEVAKKFLKEQGLIP